MAANMIKQALAKGLTPKCPLLINPGSEQVRYTAERDGLIDLFKQFGATIMTNACGPCIGRWDRAGSDISHITPCADGQCYYDNL